MRAVVYCRVSTTEQAHNLSLETQEKACREYCARNDYEVAEIFVDAGESAKTTDRPEFRRLLEVCRRGRGQLHAVIVYSLTRFSRNSADHHAIAGLLRGLGITLRSVTEPIDDSPAGKLMEGILAAMAQFDNDVRAQRVKHGLEAAVARGRWCWLAPLGYINADPRKGPSLVPDPKLATAVTEAFRLYDAGVRGRELIARARAMGLTATRSSADGISPSGLAKLLRQRAYIARVQPKGWPEEAQGDWQPLVDDDTFWRVQAALDGTPTRAARTKHRHLDHPDFPLRRFVRCQCGRALTGSWSRSRNRDRYGFYHCPNGCRRLPKARLETAFLAMLDELRPRAGVWRVVEAAVLDTWREEQRGADVSAAASAQRVAAIEKKLARLDDAMLEETVDATTYRAKRDELREALALARMDQTQATLTAIDVEGLLAFAQHALEHASAFWTAGEPKQRVRLQWTLLPEGLQLAPLQRGSNTHDGVVTAALFQSAVTCSGLFRIDPAAEKGLKLVDHRRPSWNQVRTWLTDLAALRPAA